MRSTSCYAGVTAHGDIGKKVIAHMNRDLSPRKLLVFHSVLHIISLAVTDSVKYLPRNWIKHIRLLYTYFSRSSKRKHQLQQSHGISIGSLEHFANQFGNIYKAHGWNICYQKIYCATGWIGLHTCYNAAIGTWLALVVLKEQLVPDNYG